MKYRVYSHRYSIGKMTKSKFTRISTIIGCSLLVLMGLFHGSGIHYVSGLVQQSNAEPFIKDIFPILFAHPTVQLLGLAGLGIVTLFMKQEIGKILFFVAVLVGIDALLAFFLGATIPGILLILSSLLFVLGGMKSIK